MLSILQSGSTFVKYVSLQHSVHFMCTLYNYHIAPARNGSKLSFTPPIFSIPPHKFMLHSNALEVAAVIIIPLHVLFKDSHSQI